MVDERSSLELYMQSNLNCIEKSEVAQDALSGCLCIVLLCLVKKILWFFYSSVVTVFL